MVTIYIAKRLAILSAVIPVLACAFTSMPVNSEPQPTQLPTPTRLPVTGTESQAETNLTGTSSLVKIREEGVVTVGVLYNHPPFGYLTGSGDLAGYEVELARKLADYWGIEVEFVQVTRQTRFTMLERGDVDILAAAVSHSRDSDRYFEFSLTTFRSGYGVLVNQSSGISELSGLTGTVLTVGDDARRLFEIAATDIGIAPTLVSTATTETALAELTESPEITAIVDRREALMLATQSKTDTQVINELVLVEPIAFVVRQGDTPLRDLIDLTLQQMIAKGELGEIFSSNFYGYPPDLQPPLPGEPSFDFASIPTQVATQESLLIRIQRGEALRVGGLQLSNDPEVFDSQPIIDGYNRAILNELARRWNVRIIELPDSVGETGLRMLESDQADLVVGIKPTLSLVGRYALSPPYYRRGLRLLDTDDLVVLGIGDLNARPSIAAPPTDISQDLIEDNNAVPRLTTVESFVDAYESLTNNLAWAIVGDEYALFLMAQSDDNLQLYDERYRATDHVMAFRTGDPDFEALLAFTLQDMSADGTIARIQEQYFGPYIPEGESLDEFDLDVFPGDEGYLLEGS